MTTTSFMRRAVLSSLLAVGLLAAATPVSAQRHARLSGDLSARLTAGDQHIDVIVDGSRADVDGLVRQHAVRVKRYLRSGAVLDINAGQLSALRDDTSVDHLSGDVVVRASAEVTRETIGADQVWDGAGIVARPLNGHGVVVAVIDSGIDWRHTALRNRLLASVDFTGGDGADGYGHGTHIASLIAGAAGRTVETADYRGVAPGARIVSLRVLDDNGVGRMSSVIDAIDWAIENQRRFDISVINLSLGAPVLQSYRDDPLGQAAARAVKAGITVVAAAGNFGQTADGKSIFGGITSPANHPAVIAVGALDTRGTALRSDDRIAKFSSKGPTMYDQLVKPDLVAPGRNIVAAEADGSTLAALTPERHVTGSGADGYIQLSGSSMSAGVVSGAVALMLDRRPGLKPVDVRAALQISASYMADAGLVASGAGSLNALAAVNLVSRSRAAGVPTTIAGETVLASGLTTVGARRVTPALGAGQSTAKSGQILGSTIIWGSTGPDTIIWGSQDPDTIIWGSSSEDTIIWGSSDHLDKVVWGTSGDDTIIWGSDGDDTIIWGSSDLDTIIWGSNADDTIIWGSRGDDTIIWGSSSDDTIIWGSNSGETIIWGSSDSDTIIWGSGSDDTIIWGSGLQDTIIWGSSSDDTIIWGSGAANDTIIWG